MPTSELVPGFSGGDSQKGMLKFLAPLANILSAWHAKPFESHPHSTENYSVSIWSHHATTRCSKLWCRAMSRPFETLRQAVSQPSSSRYESLSYAWRTSCAHYLTGREAPVLQAHGRETSTMRFERALASARLAVLEGVRLHLA